MIDLINFIISLLLIYFCLLGYGLLLHDQNRKYDIFLTIVFGYFLVGLITVLLHYFFPINNIISVSIVTFGLICIFFKKNFLKEFISIKVIIFLLFISSVLILSSKHSIDANMYHHPYVSYLKYEKIIFGIANIQFRFGHISFLQYVQAAFTNNYLSTNSIAVPNLILFSTFIICLWNKFANSPDRKITYILSIIFSSFVLIKFSRYREFGNDLIPFLIASYFLILVINHIYYKKNSYNLFYFSPLYASFMFAHKVSYIFSSLFFIAVFNKKILLEINKNKFVILLFFITTLLWLMKNFITTSCLAYPVYQTCINNTEWFLTGLSDPKSAAKLTELWAKDFITLPNWKEINLENYVNSFEWVPNWLNNHFIKILEKLSPLFIVFILIYSYIVYYSDKKFKNYKSENINSLFYLLGLIFIGLLIWFLKAPTFRYGAFYIISFCSLIFILIIFKNINKINSSKLNKLRYIFFISLIFFSIKNISRNFNNEDFTLPFTSPSFDKYVIINEDPLLLKPKNKSELCYYSSGLCSHETPSGLKISKIYNYLLFK